MTLTGKQKRYLRKLAHDLKPVFQVGKHGVTEEFNKQIIDYFDTHELLKISVLQNSIESKDEVALKVSEGTDSTVVQIIGSIIVLYKENKEHKEIELP
ncbi:MAG TPA: ribosome assembly RNA-binding protein YhbY [Candidatus Nosocomiicoccus stercorigallinarum]|nr:ribosome assembly RNA-binding protein YhbY [Candidatus Nosocomiicoccus stercorigallinarum]